jgi:nuclease S1
MNVKKLILSTLLPALLFCEPVQAWNDTGHKVVARIAWSKMNEQARRNVIDLLMRAPQDSGLRGLFRTSDPQQIRAQLFFMRAATGPDIVRDENFPARKAKYHKRDWHFINFFWQQPGANTAIDLDKEPEPRPENVVERLRSFGASVSDRNTADSTRALQIAWIMHLVGDIHQPLHCSARVTDRPDERNGDQGGNLFKLDAQGKMGLHSYWDGILDRSFGVLPGENQDDYVNRLAAILMARHPEPASNVLNLDQFEAWARAGHQTTKRLAYPPDLKRGQMPSELYRRIVQRVTEPAIALAGYRLAQMLNRLLSN